MNEYTINELLVLQSVVRSRLRDLESLASRSATEEEIWMGDNHRRKTTPKYDVKLVDRKVVELKNFLFRSDAAIKQANALTKVNITVDRDSLLAPIE